MKIHRVVQMLGATTSTGKLADDMYDLNYKAYYSEAEDRYIPISHMDFQHMVRAFVKQNDKDVRTDTQEGKVKELELENQRLVQQLEHDETVVPREAYQAMKERYEREVSKAEFWKDLWDTRVDNLRELPKGCGYAFSEIPNDTDGQEFVDTMKKYFNKKSYKMRVRGQHIKPELRGTGATYWGQNLDESTHMRIYIEAKKGD